VFDLEKNQVDRARRLAIRKQLETETDAAKRQALKDEYERLVKEGSEEISPEVQKEFEKRLRNWKSQL
jgi:hypothetical protein